MGKRETILSAGQELFAQFGMCRPTVEAIIRRAGIAKGTFYKYFQDKHALLRAIVEREYRRLVDAIRTAVGQATSSREKMRAYWLTKVRKIQELIEFYHVDHEEAHEFWPQLSEVREKYLFEEQRIVREILADGVQRGELAVDPNTIELAAYAIVMGGKGLERPWAFERIGVKVEEGVDMLLDMLFNGLQVHRGVEAQSVK